MEENRIFLVYYARKILISRILHPILQTFVPQPQTSGFHSFAAPLTSPGCTSLPPPDKRNIDNYRVLMVFYISVIMG